MKKAQEEGKEIKKRGRPKKEKPEKEPKPRGRPRIVLDQLLQTEPLNTDF